MLLLNDYIIATSYCGLDILSYATYIDRYIVCKPLHSGMWRRVSTVQNSGEEYMIANEIHAYDPCPCTDWDSPYISR